MCVRNADASLTVTLGSEDEKRSVMSALTAKYDIDEISVEEPTLNDIFVEYTA